MAESSCAAPSEAEASESAGGSLRGSAKGSAKFAFNCSTASCGAPLLCQLFSAAETGSFEEQNMFTSARSTPGAQMRVHKVAE